MCEDKQLPFSGGGGRVLLSECNLVHLLSTSCHVAWVGLLQPQIAKSYLITDRGWEMYLEPVSPHPLLASIVMFIPFSFQQTH